MIFYVLYRATFLYFLELLNGADILNFGLILGMGSRLLFDELLT